MVGIVRVHMTIADHAKKLGLSSHLELHGAGAGVPLHTISRDDENWYEGAPAETQAWLNGYAAALRVVAREGGLADAGS